MKTPLPNGIASVSRETGISKETLRMWELRYGFPIPERTGNGDRAYAQADIEKLRLLKSLSDRGQRPGGLVQKSKSQLQEILAKTAVRPNRPEMESPIQSGILSGCNAEKFDEWWREREKGQSLNDFILGTIEPFLKKIGDEWSSSRLTVAEEHLLTERLVRYLHRKIAEIGSSSSGPRVLLTTLPGERHSIGLLLVELLLTGGEFQCFSLGEETPVSEIAHVSAMLEIDIVVLSFSESFPHRLVKCGLEQLRSCLPGSTQIWVGGRGVNKIEPSPPGIIILKKLGDCVRYPVA